MVLSHCTHSHVCAGAAVVLWASLRHFWASGCCSASYTFLFYFPGARVYFIQFQENKLGTFLRAIFIPFIFLSLITSSQIVTQILLQDKTPRKKEKHIWTSVFGSNNPGSQFWKQSLSNESPSFQCFCPLQNKASDICLSHYSHITSSQVHFSWADQRLLDIPILCICPRKMLLSMRTNSSETLKTKSLPLLPLLLLFFLQYHLGLISQQWNSPGSHMCCIFCNLYQSPNQADRPELSNQSSEITSLETSCHKASLFSLSDPCEAPARQQKASGGTSALL